MVTFSLFRAINPALFRESLSKAGILDELFTLFNTRLESAGFYTKKSSMVDASFVTAPRQRTSREENAQLKEGDIPQEWSDKKRNNTDADWTKKNDQVYFGYKNHIKAEVGSKLIPVTR